MTFEFRGGLDTEDIEQANSEVESLLELLGTYYAVLDVSALPQSLEDVLRIFRDNKFLVLTEPRIVSVLVNKEHRTGLDILVFSNIQQARDYIRIQLAERKSGISFRQATSSKMH